MPEDSLLIMRREVERFMDTLKLNSERLWNNFKDASGLLFTIASVVLLFINKNDLKIDTFKRGILVIIVFLAGSVSYAIIRTLFYKKVEKIKSKLYVKYGDILKIAFSRKGAKKIVVINVNTTFDTIVDTDLGRIDKPLVAPGTVHGLWIKAMEKRNVSISEIDNAIDSSLNLQKISPCNIIDSTIKPRGKLKNYPKGTIAVYEYENTIFYLLAFSEFDENNNAQNSKEEFVSTIIKLIDYYEKHGNRYDIYLPLLGTGQSRTGIEREDSLEILTSMFKLYKEKIHGTANVIVYSKDRNKVSLGL